MALGMFARMPGGLQKQIFSRPLPSLDEEQEEEERKKLMFPMEDTPLPQVDPLYDTPKPGYFGAGKQERGFGDWARAIGAGLTNIGQGAGGEDPTAMSTFLQGEQAKQAKADYAARLDDMGLSMEERMFAEANPEAFMKGVYDQQALAKKNKTLMGQLDPLGLPPELLARAQMNPEEFGKQLAKEAGTVQTNSFHDPINGWDMRPASFADETDRYRVTNDGRKIDNDLQFHNDELPYKKMDSVTRRQNADTAAINAKKDTPGQPQPTRFDGGPGVYGFDNISYEGGPPDDGGGYSPPPQPQREYGGARVIKIGIGPNGEWQKTDQDGEMTNGIPAPRFNDMTSVDIKSRGAAIRAENDEILKKIEPQVSSANEAKAMADRFVSLMADDENGGKNPYYTGYGANLNPLRGADPRTSEMNQINAALALKLAEASKGAMSETDREWFKRGVVSIDNSEKANVSYAQRVNAAANRINQYNTWIKSYRAAFGQGVLPEAKRYWNEYMLSNPVFDDKGTPVETYQTIPTITEWFANKPAAGGVFSRKDSSRADNPQQRSVSEMSDDELKKKLGIK